MNQSSVISWIYLATAFASAQKPANLELIAQIADEINHATPNIKELQTSLSWLANHGFVEALMGITTLRLRALI